MSPSITIDGVQSCLRFEHFSLSRLMHKTSYSVFGKIDFFSVLQALMASLGGSLLEDWVVRSPELTKVNSSFCRVSIRKTSTRQRHHVCLTCKFVRYFQTVTRCKLDVTTLPILCRELINEWKNVVRYLTTHAPSQEGQGSRGRVRFLLFLYLGHIGT